MQTGMCALPNPFFNKEATPELNHAYKYDSSLDSNWTERTTPNHSFVQLHNNAVDSKFYSYLATLSKTIKKQPKSGPQSIKHQRGNAHLHTTLPRDLADLASTTKHGRMAHGQYDILHAELSCRKNFETTRCVWPVTLECT